MATAPFKFKQFTIDQDRCAMKIGTDGVLLGAWTSLDHFPDSILDIGTGTGVIALMLAQRSDAQTIDALELEDKAFEQASENFESSDWGDRLFCYHAHLYEFAVEVEEQYELIVVNPPFYKEDFKSNSSERDIARFEDAMPFDLLVGAVAKLLAPHGHFDLILPFDREEDFITLASKADLVPIKITRVKGTPTSEIKRSLLSFCFRCSKHSSPKSIHQPIQTDELVIENSRHNYTEEYVNLVKDFYLKM